MAGGYGCDAAISVVVWLESVRDTGEHLATNRTSLWGKHVVILGKAVHRVG